MLSFFVLSRVPPDRSNLFFSQNNNSQNKKDYKKTNALLAHLQWANFPFFIKGGNMGDSYNYNSQNKKANNKDPLGIQEFLKDTLNR